MRQRRAALLVDAGIWLRLAGDKEGARKLFEQAFALDPENHQAARLLSTAGAEEHSNPVFVPESAPPPRASAEPARAWTRSSPPAAAPPPAAEPRSIWLDRRRLTLIGGGVGLGLGLATLGRGAELFLGPSHSKPAASLPPNPRPPSATPTPALARPEAALPTGISHAVDEPKPNVEKRPQSGGGPAVPASKKKALSSPPVPAATPAAPPPSTSWNEDSPFPPP